MQMTTAVRGIRGATTASENNADDICEATRELLKEMVESNQVDTEDIASILFSATTDLNSAFPARAAREIGWTKVPLFCHVEIDVPGALQRCIRVLILANTSLEQDQVKHIYLKGTVKLRDF